MGRYLCTQVVCLIMCCQLVWTHLCLLRPLQRGGLTSNINEKGSDTCFFTEGPCELKKFSNPDIFWSVNENVTIVFQKNLDHWSQASLGFFSVKLINETSKVEILNIPDKGEPSLTIFTPTFLVPDVKSVGRTVLQVSYVTKNPKAPPVFYQCADVQIV